MYKMKQHCDKILHKNISLYMKIMILHIKVIVILCIIKHQYNNKSSVKIIYVNPCTVSLGTQYEIKGMPPKPIIVKSPWINNNTNKDL